jgi:hypothetical protein
MFSYVKTTVFVKDFIRDYHDIDCNPEHQRLPRELKLQGTKEPSKAQKIINSLLLGMDIGQLTVHLTPKGKFKKESIDGGHRKRYIYAFFQNKFSTFNGKFFRDLSPAEQNKFLNMELTFCTYDNLTPEQVGLIFRSLNDSTPVNHQEMLNSYGSKPIAKVIRETVRTVAGVGNTFHPLFDYNQRDDEQKFTVVGFNNDGLRIDEMVARIFYRYYAGGGLGTCCDDDLEKMYQDQLSMADCLKIKKKVVKCLDFVQLMAQCRRPEMKNNLPQKEFVLFSRIHMYLEEKFGDFKIPNEVEFFSLIYKAYGPYKLPYDEQPEELQETSPLSNEKTIGKQFNDSLGEHRPAKSVEFPIERIMNSINILSVIVPLDPKRIFPREWREAKIIEQNYKCAISGERINMSNSQGGHIIAWANGGRTEYSNLAMISTKHNKAMGTMSVNEYKKTYDMLNSH